MIEDYGEETEMMLQTTIRNNAFDTLSDKIINATL